MKSPHRRSLLWQSACILLPLVLLAGLAVWHLFDARKIALEEARAQARDLAFRLSKNLDEQFVDLHSTSEPQIDAENLEAFFYPLSPPPAKESIWYRRFVEARDSEDKLGTLLLWIDNPPPLLELGEPITPSGLPLEPLMRWRMVELTGGVNAVVERFVKSAVETHPSILSESLLQKARVQTLPDVRSTVNHIGEAGYRRWRVHEKFRDQVRPLLGDGPPTESLWTDTDWLSFRDGTITLVAGKAIDDLAARSIAEEKERLPEYIGADIFVGDRNFTPKKGDEDRVTWSLDNDSEGFIPIERVSHGPINVATHITDTSALYAKVRTQTYWYAAVIAISTLAALLGLLALRRSYARQLELGEMKSNFVASVSHELRAPVASVRLLAERLRSGKVADDTKRDEYYGFIEGESRRLGTLVENILDFSRIERGLKDYRLTDTDLSELLRDTVGTMQHHAAEREVTLATDLADGELHVEADAEELRQALVNLIDNAIKFSPEGSAVTVGADLENNNARLWVTDRGTGVPEAEREKIFERFYRSGSEMTRETQGAGIGLSIVNHIAKGHGGEVSIVCPSGGGSTFTLTFPSQRTDA